MMRDTRVFFQPHALGDRAVAAQLLLQNRERLLRRRSRVTRPNAQSVISAPPVNHSSVQEKKIVPAAPPFTTQVEMPVEHFRLHLFAFADRVHAELAHDERLFAREILQPCEVALEIEPALEIDVKA